jgi:hypothetical protein
VTSLASVTDWIALNLPLLRAIVARAVQKTGTTRS